MLLIGISTGDPPCAQLQRLASSSSCRDIVNSCGHFFGQTLRKDRTKW